MQQEEMDLREFMNCFRMEQDFRDHFFRFKWPDGFICYRFNSNVNNLIAKDISRLRIG
jgi:hypothetical protein